MEKPADEHDPVVRLVAVADDAVPAHAVGAWFVRVALADHSEPVRVVDIEHGVVPTGEPGEVLQVRRVPGHAVDAVHADQARGRAVLSQELLEVVRILEPKPLHGRAAGRRELAAVVDRLVRPVVDKDRAVAGQHRDHGQMDQRDRRNDERVLATEKLDQALLDLRVQHRAAEHPRPTRMRPPLVEILGNGLDDLAIEVESEVVAGSEIGQPLVADPDHPAVDLVDDGVRHRVGALELDQLATGGEPPIDPARRSGRRAGAVPAENAHAPQSTFLPKSLGVLSSNWRWPNRAAGAAAATSDPVEKTDASHLARSRSRRQWPISSGSGHPVTCACEVEGPQCRDCSLHRGVRLVFGCRQVRRHHGRKSLLIAKPTRGFEPRTPSLRVKCSTS